MYSNACCCVYIFIFATSSKLTAKNVLITAIVTTYQLHYFKVRHNAACFEYKDNGNFFSNGVMFKVYFIIFSNDISFRFSFMCGRCDRGLNNGLFFICLDNDTIFRQLFLHQNDFLSSVDDKVTTWIKRALINFCHVLFRSTI